MGNNPYRSESRTLAVRRNDNSWFPKLLTLILVAGLIAGGLVWYWKMEPGYTSHNTPPEVVAVKVVDHPTLGKIGIMILEGGHPLMSKYKPAVNMGKLGDWSGATMIEVPNNPEDLRFRITRPVPGSKTGEEFVGKKFWALSKG